MDFLFYAFSVLIFIAVALAIEVGWQWWFSTQSAAARRALQRRKTVAGEGQKNGAHVSLLKERRLAASDTGERLLRDLPQMDALDLRLQQAGGHRTTQHSTEQGSTARHRTVQAATL